MAWSHYAVPADLQKQYAIASVSVVLPTSVPPVAFSAVIAPVPTEWSADRPPYLWPLTVSPAFPPCVPGALVPSVPIPSVNYLAVPALLLPTIAAPSVVVTFA